MTERDRTPAQNLPVYRAEEFVVAEGTNVDDALSIADDLLLDDIYALVSDAKTKHLMLHATDSTHFTLATNSGLGTPGATVHPDCAVTLMSPDGQTSDAIVLVEVAQNGAVAAIYLLPLTALTVGTRYTLIGIDRDGARDMMAQLACARFVRGTHITLASGAQKRIEDLVVGDRVLTRNDGPQPVRWIGISTVRAVGGLAPIRIRAGALNNAHDLFLSPNHRLFVFQRKDQLGTGRTELMVKVRHLVNGDSVAIQSGGFVDYFELLFDTHQIIYAEGIAAESTLVDPRTIPTAPDALRARLTDDTSAGLSGLDVTESLLDRPDAAELLRRASLAR